MLIIPRFRRIVYFAVLLALALTLVTASPSKSVPLKAPSAVTSLVSWAYDGSLSEGHSNLPSSSADGRFIAFDSWSSNLVQGGYHLRSVYVRDMQTGTNEFVSVSTSGGQTSAANATISADGRFVAFETSSSNLVVGDTNNCYDIFVRDRQSDLTERISVSSNEDQANANAFSASISADGRFIAFHSEASNLVSEDTNNFADVFVRDRQAGTTELVSVASDGSQSNTTSRYPTISADGRYVFFESNATNLVPNDTNGAYDIFVRDRQAHTTERISISSQGVQANHHSHFPSTSADGRYIVFESYADNLAPNDTNILRADIYLRDRQTGTTELISRSLAGTSGNDWSAKASVSDDGRWVAFASVASNLVPGDTNGQATDIFVFDRQINQVERVSVSTGGEQAIASSDHPRIRADGGAVVFDSGANNLVDDDDNGVNDIFIRELEHQTTPALDLSIISVEPVQVLEGQPLVRNKATAIRVDIRKSGDDVVAPVQVSITLGSSTFSRFYVADPGNMPDGALVYDNTSYLLEFPAGDSDKTVYFIDPGLTPTGTTYQVSATVRPPDGVSETNPNNNSMDSTILPVYDTRWSGVLNSDLSILYFQTDWGISLSEFTNYTHASSRFIKGVYPVAEDNFNPFITTNYFGDTRPLRGNDGKLTPFGLNFWLYSQAIWLRYAQPTVDVYVSVVPSGWFENISPIPQAVGYTNRGIPVPIVILESSSPAKPNGSPTLAHEIGHTYDLHTVCEEYYYPDANCAIKMQNHAPADRIGELVPQGFWVEQRIPMLVNQDRPIYCFMGANPSQEYWVDEADYLSLLNNHRVSSFLLSPAQSQAILAAGMIDITGTVTLDDWYIIPEGIPDTLPSGPYSFVFLNADGDTLQEIPFNISFRGDTGDGSIGLNSTPFVFMLPEVAGVSRIQVRHNGETKAEKVISPHVPVVSLLSPNGGEIITRQLTIDWDGSDHDGDTLTYIILLSQDNGSTWEPVIGSLTETSLSWDISGLQPGQTYRLKVIATDGFNTVEDVSDNTFTILGHTYLPINIKSP